jgi:hypothetical protein
MLEPAMPNILVLTILISVLTQTKVPALLVMDTDTKKLNFNSFLIPMFRVNFVRGKDINLKSYELRGEEKRLAKSLICILMKH